MTLNVSVIKSPSGVSLPEPQKTFGESGATIGRGDGNSWVLDDPDRYLSSKHCSLSFEGGSYYLTDLSTNGTFLNGAHEPVGKGGKVKLKNGDTIELGDYQFQVGMVTFGDSPSAAPSASPDPFANPDPFASADPFASDPFASPSDKSDPFASPAPSADPFASPDPFAHSGGNDPFSSPVNDPFATPQHDSLKDLSLSPEPDNVDPLAALDKANFSNTSDVFSSSPQPQHNDDTFGLGNTHSDGAGALNQAVNWPEATSGDSHVIPDDWDDLLGPDPSLGSGGGQSAAPTPPPPRKPEIPKSMPLTDPPKMPPQRPAPARHQEPLLQERPPERVDPFTANESPAPEPAPRPKPQTPRPEKSARAGNTASSTNAAQALLEAMGLADRSLSDADVEEISALVGQLMPVIVTGMMQVLRSRTSIKNEFRMNVTTIQPVENNPLKFSATPAEAIENMFVRKSGAFKHPVDAFREGFDGIGEHQVAIIAGIRAAFKGMMESFDPERLEQQFERQNKGVALPGMQKARYWASYQDYFKGFVDNMENSFQYLFGDVFVEAYEDQLRKLAVDRKRQSSDGNV